MKAFNLDEILPGYIYVTRQTHSENFETLKAYHSPNVTGPGVRFSGANSPGEMLEKIISYLESDLANLKRHQKNSVIK